MVWSYIEDEDEAFEELLQDDEMFERIVDMIEGNHFMEDGGEGADTGDGGVNESSQSNTSDDKLEENPVTQEDAEAALAVPEPAPVEDQPDITESGGTTDLGVSQPTTVAAEEEEEAEEAGAEEDAAEEDAAEEDAAAAESYETILPENAGVLEEE